MWQNIIKWFKKIKWTAIIDSHEMIFFFPLVVFALLVFWDIYNPIYWIVLAIWLLVIYRNYNGALTA